MAHSSQHEPEAGPCTKVALSGPRPTGSIRIGPGALYTIGNVLALVTGIVVSLRENRGAVGVLETLQGHLAGSPEAVLLTTAIIVFMISGHVYQKAGKPDAPAGLMPLADFLSGLAAIGLTIALVMMGDTVAALVAGVLLTLGKLGSAALPVLGCNQTSRLETALRLTVAASRIPSIISLALVVLPAFQGIAPTASVTLPVVMIACFLLWFWADVLLLLHCRHRPVLPN